MSENALNRMTADAALTRDLNQPDLTFDEMKRLLHNAVERSPEVGFTRDPETGQFVRRDPLTPAAQDAAAKDAADAAPREFKKTERIGNQDFEFTASSAEALELQISSAKTVAAALASDESVTPRSARAAAARNAEQDVLDKVDADMALRRGEITAAEYLQRTHAIEDALAEQGVDLNAIGRQQFEQSWAEATATFLQSDAGSRWPGGTKNRALLGDKLAAMGLTDAADKVAALASAYEALKKAGTLFDGDFSQAQVEAMTDKATPQEILQAWKESVQPDVHGDATPANDAFIKNFNGSSGIFGK
jgi:hypothetical protein